MFLNQPIRIILFAWIFSTLACGYQFAAIGKLPFGIKKLSIPMFENHTGEIGAEVIVTRAFTDELVRNTEMMLTKRKNADAVLLGEMTAARIETISRKDQHVLSEQRITLALVLKLTDTKGKILWSSDTLSANEAYNVISDDKLATESNRQKAIATLSQRLAEDVYYRLIHAF